MVNKLLRTGVLTLFVFNAACSVFGVRSEENPNYAVVYKEGNKEIRQYDAYITAKTTTKGSYEQAQGEAFRILAGYIFGKNYGDQKIAMTAPVVVENANQQQKEGKKISMTAPVFQQKDDKGWTMSFMMPAKYKMEDLPKPKDGRITFQRVPPRMMAAITYSWGRGGERNAKMTQELIDWLKSRDLYRAASAPVSAGYDPPWTLPFLRRNEILVEVIKKEKK